MLQILRFNWPWYASAGAMPILLFFAVRLTSISPLLLWLGFSAAGCALFWAVTSLWVSHWVYDLSPLQEWNWISTVIPNRPAKVVNIHAGFDPMNDALAGMFPSADLAAWDMYRPQVMTERSIERARRLDTSAPRPASVDFHALPVPDNRVDAILAIFAAHEIRSAGERTRFFLEICRILKPGGVILLVEHLRDWKNFLAYGPGFLHFLPRREWLRLANRAGLCITRDFTFTPFVGVFALTKPK